MEKLKYIPGPVSPEVTIPDESANDPRFPKVVGRTKPEDSVLADALSRWDQDRGGFPANVEGDKVESSLPADDSIMRDLGL